MTAREEIQFAVRFSQLDLAALRPGDVLNLRDDLEGFVVSPVDHPGPILGSGVSRPFPQDYDLDDFSELQRAVKPILEKAIRREPDYRDPTQIERLEFNLLREDSEIGSYVYVTGSVRDVFLIRFFFLLAQEGVDNLKTCPECDAIYYKNVGWQKYCSRRCSNLASVKRFQRRKKAEKAKEGKVKP